MVHWEGDAVFSDGEEHDFVENLDQELHLALALVKYSAFAGSRDLLDGILDKFASIFLKRHECRFSRQHSQYLTFVLVLAVN